MTPLMLMTNAVVGDVVQVAWTTAVFDPDFVIKPGESSTGLKQIFSCGFVADVGTDYITLGFDALYESGSTSPSFRTTLTIPVSNIKSAEIYGKLI